jgi:histidyl-tRNA synthetase
METANKLRARYALILGDNEINAGVYALKDMTSGEQLNVARDGILAALK